MSLSLGINIPDLRTMRDKEYISYEPPMIDIIEVEVEKGFATSAKEGDANGSISTMPWG